MVSGRKFQNVYKNANLQLKNLCSGLHFHYWNCQNHAMSAKKVQKLHEKLAKVSNGIFVIHITFQYPEKGGWNSLKSLHFSILTTSKKQILRHIKFLLF